MAQLDDGYEQRRHGDDYSASEAYALSVAEHFENPVWQEVLNEVIFFDEEAP